MSMKSKRTWGGLMVLGLAVATFVAAERRLDAD